MIERENYTRALTIAISGRALFDAEESHSIFLNAGADAFRTSEADQTLDPLEIGVGYQFIKRMQDLGERAGVPVSVVVISRRDPTSGARVLRSLSYHGIKRVLGCFTNGASDLTPYLKAYGADLFLSRDPEDTQRAMDGGIAAATLMGDKAISDGEELVIAFDGDAVLFSEEAEAFYQRTDLSTLLERESDLTFTPLEAGPFLPFAIALRDIQAQSRERLVKIVLVTARQGGASERAMRTLLTWGIPVDEAYFLGDTPKARVLTLIKPHLFLDDGRHHIVLAANHVASGLVPWRNSTASA